MATAVEEAGLTFSVDAASLTTTSSQQNEPTDSGCTLDDTQSTVNVIRKIICRYGRGCTHQDPLHLERFWHPPLPQLSEEKLRTHYICNECGQASPSLQELQTHLERKTAWSNSSLVGCRISCLVDYKEWHEALVTQFHKSGKHFVEFRLIGERRWLNMKKIAFYIVERPNLSIGEYKDDEMGDTDGMAPLEPENWVYCENISLDYAFSQSVLYKAYGGIVQETGHKTKGHVCLTDDDKDTAKCMGGSLLYGELLPRGANKAFNPKRLDAGEASVLFDLGMGTGKIAMQAFLQFRNLDYVYGIELSEGRYKLAEDAALLMVSLLGEESFSVQLRSGRSIIITEIATEQESARVLHLECGNMFEVANMDVADIVMMETDIPAELHTNLCTLLGSMHEGSRTLTYLDLRKIWNQGPIPFKQLDVNRHLSDRFPTSWSVQRGHHFFLWSRICMPTRDARVTYNGQESQDGGHMTYSSRAVSKCLPFNLGISSLVGYLRSGGKLKHRDNINERIIPLNADGTRSCPTVSLDLPSTVYSSSTPTSTRSISSSPRNVWEQSPGQDAVKLNALGSRDDGTNRTLIGDHYGEAWCSSSFRDSDTMHTPIAIRSSSGHVTAESGNLSIALHFDHVDTNRTERGPGAENIASSFSAERSRAGYTSESALSPEPRCILM